jgi:cell division protease FtsH
MAQDSQSPDQRPMRKNNPRKMEPPQWGKGARTFFIWVGLFLIALLASQRLSDIRQKEVSVDYNRFMALMQDGKVVELTIQEQTAHGKASEALDAANTTLFKLTLPNKPDFATTEKWRNDYKVSLRFKEDSISFWSIFWTVVPWIVIFGVWMFFLRRMQGGGGSKNIFSFGKSRARMWTENLPKVTFDDVAGADEAKTELREIIEFLKEPEKFQRLGGKIPKGALLLGPPGTGKTLLAKAVAGEAGVPFFSMSGADFVEMFVGVGASRVRDLFDQGKRNAPCIIFIDELDAVGRHRGAGLGGGHDEREQTLNQLLVEMDGFEFNEGVILIAATNRPDVLDSALLRPGRFDRQIVVDLPDVRGREGILKVHTKKIPMARGINLSILAKGTPGFSGADLANMVNEAALLAARKNKSEVDANDLEEAKDKVLMGTERKSLILSDAEKRTTAYHEAGHVLVSRFTPGSDPVHKVTIIPRGRALGLTQTLPMDEKHNYSKSYCLATLRRLLGGRAAEKVVFSELSTGAGDDIKRATDLARKMVCEWGMSEVLGPMTFGEKNEEIFLGREIAQHRDYSEKTAQIIDQEIRQLIEEAMTDVEKMMRDHIDDLNTLAKALLEKEILDGSEIEQILQKETVPAAAGETEMTAQA